MSHDFFESLEDRQLLSVSIPTRHAVPAHHPAHLSVSYRVRIPRFDGVHPIIRPTPPFSGADGGGTGTGTGDGGGGIINHPGGLFTGYPHQVSTS